MNMSWIISWRNPPAVASSKFGKTLRKVAAMSGDLRSSSASVRLMAAMTSPKNPMPRPQARATESRSPKARPMGPRSPSVTAGSPGVRTELDAPRSRRANASIPTASNT